MNVSDAELRALVREAVARHLGEGMTGMKSGVMADADVVGCREHASHGLLSLVRGADAGDACLIEPAVRCNHCGYCQSYGH
jgi:hypothetical protein